MFPGIKWNEAIQGLSTLAAYEFQGWARTTTYIHTPGSYIVTCLGTLIYTYLDMFVVMYAKYCLLIDFHEKNMVFLLMFIMKKMVFVKDKINMYSVI